MQLGKVAPGIVHTVRYLRGSQVVQNKDGHVLVELNPKGGITFFFEINHNKGTLLFTSAIALETDLFDKREGRAICDERARIDSAKTFTIPYDSSEELMEQVFNILKKTEENGEIQDKPYLRTLLAKMRLYDEQNADAAAFYQDMLDNGVIVIPEE